MSRLGRWLGLTFFATTVGTAGCALGKKPYVADPLLTQHRGVWGDRVRAAKTESGPAPEPAAPAPPADPLIGSPLIAVDAAKPPTSQSE
jgi:hypothetical protein